MKVKTLIKTLQSIVADWPEAANLEFVPEPKKVWRHYTLYTGFSKRHRYGKKAQIIWRMK